MLARKGGFVKVYNRLTYSGRYAKVNAEGGVVVNMQPRIILSAASSRLSRAKDMTEWPGGYTPIRVDLCTKLERSESTI